MKAYLAGPDVFLPNAAAHAQAKIAICARHGIIGLPPEQAWRGIFKKDLEMMEECDIIIANLTPFRGASADAGTLIEVGWFLGQGKKVFGYSNTATLFAPRSHALVAAVPDPIAGLLVEGFGLPDNLMVPGAVEYGGGFPIFLPADGVDRAFDALDVFALCVARIGGV
jgi:nucleoside 2-deoxyribosyltransferase